MVDAPSGLGGGKFRPYVKAIIEAERAPIRQIEARKAKEGERSKLMQEFTGKVRKMTDTLRELDNFRKFREMKSDLGTNGELVGVEVDKNVAEPGEYQLEIVQLAGRHSMISDGYEDPESEIGVGYFYYQLPNGDSKSVYLDSDSNTLRSLVTAINKEQDLGLQANLVNDGSGSDAPWRIIVAGKKTGMDQDLIYPDFYFVDGDVRFTIDDERAAQSAIVKLNGFEILSPMNKVNDLIPGVSLDLKQAKEGYEFTISIKEDIAKIAGKIKGLVDNINAVLEFINKQNQLDEKSDTSRTLGGDGTLRGIEAQLRNLIASPIYIGGDSDGEGGRWARASDVGMRFQRTGLLAFDQEVLQKKMTGEFNEVADYFVGPQRFVDKLGRITESLVGMGNGVLTQREKGFRDRMKQMDDQIAQKEIQIGRKEESLKARFANVEATMQSMQGQQQYLMQALGGGGQAG